MANKHPSTDNHLFNIADEISELRLRVTSLEADRHALRQEVLALRIELANSRQLPVTVQVPIMPAPTLPEAPPPLPKVWCKSDTEC